MATKVLQVVGKMDIGGLENLLFSLLKPLQMEGIHFDFVQHGNDEAFYNSRIVSSGSKIYRCPKYRFYNHYAYTKWWDRFFNAHPEYEIVHSHVRSTASIILKIAGKSNRRTISHAHGVTSGKGMKALIRAFLQRDITKYSDLCLACSEDAGTWLFGKDTVRGNSFHVINNYVDLERFKFSEAERTRIRHELGLAENVMLLGHVGNFRPEKNHAFILKLLEILLSKESHWDWRLLFVGAGVDSFGLRRLARKLGVFDKVIFYGAGTNVPSLMSAMDCFIFPSTFEGFGLAALEAQASGLITFLSPNIPKEVEATSLAVRLQDFQPESWANLLFERAHTFRVRGDVLSQIRAKGFDFDSVKKRYVDLYHEVQGQK